MKKEQEKPHIEKFLSKTYHEWKFLNNIAIQIQKSEKLGFAKIWTSDKRVSQGLFTKV